jgi:peptidoglycan/LPS O-acetylase OafA/YrhL
VTRSLPLPHDPAEENPVHTPADTPAPACHAPADAGPPMTARRRWRKLTVHYLEMVIAMAVGMVALHPVWTFALDALGWSGFLDSPEAMAMVMATNMTIAMTAWMRFRGHTWRPCVEMGAAMYLPFVVLFVPMWAGRISSGAMFLWGHVLMLVAMAGAMAIRPHEYAHC